MYSLQRGIYFCVVLLAIKSRTLHMLGLHSQPRSYYFMAYGLFEYCLISISSIQKILPEHLPCVKKYIQV